MKEDEKQFLVNLYINSDLTPRDIINGDSFTINYKRAWYLLNKWTNKDWYDYGVTLDLGWLTNKGMEVASETNKKLRSCEE